MAVPLKLLTLLTFAVAVLATEDTTLRDVLIVEAKEINGEPVAEERSSNIGYPPRDQMAVESIDRSHATYASPPANLIRGPVPVPVHIPINPGNLVLPGLPRRHQLSQYSRQLPRRPPQPMHKRPHPVRTNYAPPPLRNVHRKQSHVDPKFMQPPPPSAHNNNGYVPPGSHGAPSTGFSLPPPPQNTHQANTAQNFGYPKDNDLLYNSESGISSVYTAPQGGLPQGGLPHDTLQVPYALPQSAPQPQHAQQQSYSLPQNLPQLPLVSSEPEASHHVVSAPVESYVPPGLPESRQPILNIPDAVVEEAGQSSLYVPPTGPGSELESWPVSAPEMPQIVSLDVKCEKNSMKVRIEFDQPFNGIIFSKGHYSNSHCVHLPAGLGRTQSTFDISINSCGTSGNTENGLYGYGSQSGSGTFFENTIVIQYDPQVQEVWDGARKLRCSWHDQYEKSVTFRPFAVDMLDVVRADFAGDNVGCWMQVQVGKGPWASEVSGLVKIGQTMTMVLAIKDDDSKFDMLVRNCMAHDGKRPPIQLVDQRGCITRPKLMSRFTKIKDFGASASVLSYAHFQAFKFPDSMEVHFQCTIQICRFQCPEQCSDQASIGGYTGSAREKREAIEGPSDKAADVGVNRVIQVVSTRDLSFILDKNGVEEKVEVTKETLVSSDYEDIDGLICMSTPGFSVLLVFLLGALIVSLIVTVFLCIRLRLTPGARPFINQSFDNPAFMRKNSFDYQ